MLKRLPSTTASFRKIFDRDLLYIDKTKYIYELLLRGGGAYFLARPRRFGKSLLLSTMDEIFSGHRELFQGLWIDSSDYDWPVHPVIRIDFSLYPSKTPAELEANIKLYLRYVAERYGLELPDLPYFAQFGELIRNLSQERQVVILIDEYDKPIIDHLTNVPVAEEMRDVLKGFYAVVKSMEDRIRMVFITGVSKFSRVSIFSELNNLIDLTTQATFANALGLTETEIRETLAGHIEEFAAKEELDFEGFMAKMRHWYDGFRFAAEGENLYNPFSTMQLFENQHFSNYWFTSGTPTFLIRLLHDQNYDVSRLNSLVTREIAFSTYDIKHLDVVPLLFQTGYLTIKGYTKESDLYELAYPNFEVEDAFTIYLLDAFSNLELGFSASYQWQLIEALRANDLDEFFRVLKVFYANIDYDLHLRNEKYYQTIFYLIFTLMGLSIQAEVRTNDGRIDAVAETNDRIYIFEFKLDQDAQTAIDQIAEKAYALKYGTRGKPITQVGVNFDSSVGQVAEWKVVE